MSMGTVTCFSAAAIPAESNELAPAMALANSYAADQVNSEASVTVLFPYFLASAR